MADKVKTDVLLKDFWRVNERFADLFNAVVFQGKEVLKAEELQEMDTDMSGIIRFKEHEESLVRMRDVVKKMAFGVEFAVFGIGISFRNVERGPFASDYNDCDLLF
jgi:hypothetical protein